MEFIEAISYVIGFALIWAFTLILAACFDYALRRLLGLRIFPDGYWRTNNDGR